MNFLNFKSEQYIVNESPEVIFGLIRSEFDKKLCDSSEGKTKNGGLQLYPSVFFVNFRTDLGPIAGINLSGLSISEDGQKSKITLNRINGLTYKLQMGFAISTTIIFVLLWIFQFSSEHTDKNLNLLIILMLPLIYVTTIEAFADIITSNLKHRIEIILKQKSVVFKKQ